MKKLLISYLVLSGIAAHVAALTLWLFAPGVVDKGRAKVSELVSRHVPSVLPSATAAVPAVNWEQARAALRQWQPYPAGGLAPGRILVDGHPVSDLRQAAGKLRDGSVLEIGEGTYRNALVTRAPNIRIVGRGHVVFDGAIAEGKASFVVKGNNTHIENIECRNVKAGDGNGACVRLEGQGLLLDKVYFHSAQSGLLTGGKPGDVTIRDSFFERLGHGGRAHAIYQGGGTLRIEKSYILASKSEGHEVKSRAALTEISNSVVASLIGKDSRLIDISDGGILRVTDSTLQQGPNSQNLDLIGFALESRRYPENSIVVQRNVVILERNGSNRLLHSKADNIPVEISDNIIVSPSDTGFDGSNLVFDSRAAAKMPAYPGIPDRPN